MIDKRKIFFIVVAVNILLSPKLLAEVNVREVVTTATSLFVNQNDSIIQKEFRTIDELYKQRKYSEAYERALKLKTLVDTKKYIHLQVKTLHLLAKILRNTGSYSKALSYLKQAKNISEKALIRDFSNNNLKIEYAKGLLDIASEFQRQDKIDSAKFYYSKLVLIQSMNKEFLELKAMSFNNLSNLFANKGEFNKAEEYLKEAILIHKNNNDKALESAALGNLGNILLMKSNFKEAKRVYLEALSLIEGVKTTKSLKYKEDLYYNLAYAMYMLKDYKAYDFQELSYEIKDTLRDRQMREIILEQEAKYNFDAKRTLFEKEKELEKEKLKNYTWLVGIIGVSVAMILLFIVYSSRLRRRNLRLEIANSKLEKNKEIENLKTDAQIRIINATIDGKETERKQIAETLHDSVSTLLSSATLHLEATKKHFQEQDSPQEIAKTQKIIEEAASKIRNLSHNLVSSVLLKFGLSFAVKDIVKKYTNSELAITTDISKISRYNQEFEIKIYNIIQEFLNNIIKHSEASEALVVIFERAENLHVKVLDNGKGFNRKEIKQKDGLGINQIEARVKMMNGTFKVNSDEGEGTSISVKIPVTDVKLSLT